MALGLTSFAFDYSDSMKRLARAKHDGFLEAIPALADKAAAALQPVEHNALVDRLTMLGMSMANGKDAAQVQAWLHETARLLADLPQSILCAAIDDCVKEPGRVFVPSVGEIREKAADQLRRKEREAVNLRRLANLIAEGVEIPEWEPTPFSAPPPAFRDEDRCSPEAAKAILAEFGLRGSVAEGLADMLKPPAPPKSRADYIAEGREPPPIKPDEPIYV